MAEIVAGCQRGERYFQRRLYDLFHVRVFRLAVRLVGQQDAPDAMQNVFLQTFRNISQFSSRAQFATWLYRVTLNECLQFRRRRSRREWDSLVIEPLDGTPSHAKRVQYRDLLEQALAAIDPALRAIFLLREVDALSYADIAEALQVPVGTVGSRLNRARDQLREKLLDLGWEPYDGLLDRSGTAVGLSRPRAGAGV